MKKQHPLLAAAFAAALSSTTAPAKDKNPDFHPLLVSPANLQSWVFHTDGAPEGIFRFVAGPQATSQSAGSLEIGTADPTQRCVFATGAFAGFRLDDLKTLKFDMRRSTPASGTASPVLQLEMDFDLNDSTTSSQGMLVFDP
ncbi:MAG TPA: hypothetical protein VHM91_12310, partial [Verrucomicrobiales bacterium]|nr:hypothetical protein [Verrucomicrobiales bacterium]